MDLNGIDWNVFSHGNHVGGIAAGSKNGKVMHGVAFDAIKRMYFKLMSEYKGEPEPASGRGSYRAATTSQQMAQILTFINLPAAQAGPALNAVTLNAAAQSMTLVQRNSMTGDFLSSHFADRFREERKADALLPLQSRYRSPASPQSGAASSHPSDAPQKQSFGGAVTNVTEGAADCKAISGNSAWFKFVYNKGKNLI